MASVADGTSEDAGLPLPLWRLIGGVAVLSVFVVLLVVAGLVYADNFRLDGYMRELAAQPASVALSDPDLVHRIQARASQLDLPVHADDISVTRNDGRPRIRIARYSVQTYLGRMDLRLPEAASR